MTRFRAAVVMACGILAIGLARGQSVVGASDGWSAPLQAALLPYRDGDFREAVRICRQIALEVSDPSLQREAEALAGLALLHSDDRGERLDARAHLGIILEARPDIQERGEYLLAQGRASSGLDETAAAIEYLQAAVAAFDAQGSPRALLAISELADVWPVHGEWNVPVTGVDVAPRSPEENVALKISKLDELEKKIEGRPGAGAVRAKIELRRAELRSGGDPGAGIDALRALSLMEPMDATIAAAGVQLAELYESRRQWSDALRAYRRVAVSGVPAFSERAARAAAAIELPQAELQLSAQTLPDQTVEAKLRFRNMSRPTVEVRRLDLAAWLEQRRGQYAASGLPEEGAVVVAEDRTAPPGVEHAWWDASVSLRVPTGVFVVVVRDGQAVSAMYAQKQLLISSALEATLFTGVRYATVCVNRPEASIRFWMDQSFAAMERKAHDGVIVFPLPPEARLRGERRWTCLVSSGEELVLCEGRLADEAADPDRLRDAIVSIAPREPRIGETVTISGMVHRTEATPRAGAEPLEIRLVDSLDRTMATVRTTIDASGFFFAQAQTTIEMAGKALRAQLRQRGLLIEHAYRRPLMKLAARDATRLVADVLMPRNFPSGPQTLTGTLDARLPWGTPIGALSEQHRIDGVALPTNRPLRELLAALPQPSRGQLSEVGRGMFAVSTNSFDLPDGPLAVGVGLTVTGPDARRAEQFHQAIVNAQPVHVWVTPLPTSVQVGQPVRARVGWFDPESRAVGAIPRLAVYRDGEKIEPLPLYPGGGELQSPMWIPASPGSYEFRAHLGDAAVPMAMASEIVTVETAADSPRFEGAIDRIERVDGEERTRLRVRIRGNRPAASVLLARDGDPRGAMWIAAGSDVVEREIELVGRVSPNCRLLWYTPQRGGMRVLDDRPIPPSTARLAAIELRSVARENAPSNFRRVEVRAIGGRSLVGATVYGRVVRGENTGTVVWRGRPTELISRTDTTLRFVTSQDPRGDAAMPEGRIGAPEPFPAEVAEVILTGDSLWAEQTVATGETVTLDVPLPDRPGSHRLHVYARHASGWAASATIVVSEDPPVWLHAESPDQITAGDRTFLSVRLQNRTTQPVVGSLAYSLGRGLNATGLGLRDDAGRESPLNQPGEGIITIPQLSSVLAVIRFEAAAAGRSAAEFEFRCGDTRVKRSVPYRVFSSTANAAEPPRDAERGVRVKRAVFWVDDVAAREAAAAANANPVPGQLPPRRADAPRVSLSDGEAIKAGRLLVIQDEFTLESAASQVAWTQRAAGNCVTHGGDIEGWKTVGPISERTLGNVTFTSARIAAGTYAHETLIVPMRSGSCELPAPEIRIDGKPIHVEIEQAGFRVVVAE